MVSKYFYFVQILHHLTDIIYYGAMKPCTKCIRGNLIFCNWTYKCTHVTSWASCDHEVKKPMRSLARIPVDLGNHLNLSQITRNRTLQSFRMTDEDGTDLVFG